MAWTLRFLMSEATAMAGVAGDDAMAPSRVSFYVNQAVRDIANRVGQVEFERLATSSTSSGDDKLFLPTDCERVLNLSFDTGVSGFGGRGIAQTNAWQLDAKSQGTATGVPDYYLSYATWLELYPSPNSNYSLLLRYVARVSDITNLDSIPSVDTRYHQAALFKTASYLAMRQRDLPSASAFDTLYENELSRQRSALAQRQFNRSGFGARVQLEAD